jgi:nitrogen regulatory protein PII
MYKVDAIIRPERFAAVKSALVSQDVAEFSATAVRGCGVQEEHTTCVRGTTYDGTLANRVRVEVVVPKDVLDVVLYAVIRAARTSQHGDGLILITELKDVIEIDLDRAQESIGSPAIRRTHLASTGDGLEPTGW